MDQPEQALSLQPSEMDQPEQALNLPSSEMDQLEQVIIRPQSETHPLVQPVEMNEGLQDLTMQVLIVSSGWTALITTFNAIAT